MDVIIRSTTVCGYQFLLLEWYGWRRPIIFLCWVTRTSIGCLAAVHLQSRSIKSTVVYHGPEEKKTGCRKHDVSEIAFWFCWGKTMSRHVVGYAHLHDRKLTFHLDCISLWQFKTQRCQFEVMWNRSYGNMILPATTVITPIRRRSKKEKKNQPREQKKKIVGISAHKKLQKLSRSDCPTSPPPQTHHTHKPPNLTSNLYVQ